MEYSVFQLEIIIRMLIACICGGCIGWERKNRAKEAGVRTHCIVACGAALMMIISKYGFIDSNSYDSSRIASQIVSGIGFLGAGMIFVHKRTITGLTTAAGVWATAGIGMAFGAGMYIMGLFATFILLIVQIIFHKNSNFIRTTKLMTMTLHDDGQPKFQRRLYKKLENMNIQVLSADISNNSENGGMNYILTIDLPMEMYEEDVVREFENSRIMPCEL